MNRTLLTKWKAQLLFLISLIVIVMAFVSCGGGGGGGDSSSSNPLPESHAPVISNMILNRTSAFLYEGGGAVYVEGTFNFIDEGADMQFCTLCVSGPTGDVCENVNMPGAEGVTLGQGWIATMADTTVLGLWGWGFNCTDSNGDWGNTLGGTFLVY